MDNYGTTTSNLDASYSHIIKSTESAMLESLSDYEKSIIHRVMVFLRDPMPSMMGAIFNKIEECIELREEYNYILYKIRYKYQELSSKYNAEYYSRFSVISRQGRPNQASVEAEVSTRQEVVTARKSMEDLGVLLRFYEDEYSLLRSKERALDNKRATVV